MKAVWVIRYGHEATGILTLSKHYQRVATSPEELATVIREVVTEDPGYYVEIDVYAEALPVLKNEEPTP